MSSYVEDAVVVVDNEAEVRIVAEPGYRDDQDRDCVRLLVSVKGTIGELRLTNSDVRELAERLVSLAMGRRVRLVAKLARR